MFIGTFRIGNEDFNGLYYKRFGGWREWQKDTFSPLVENIQLLDFKIGGKTYEERKANVEEIAKEWQNNFAWLSWSYGEYAEISSWFYENAKRYGLIKVFEENAII